MIKNKRIDFGLAIAIGAGLGIVFDEFIFKNIGVGISVGAALGYVFYEIFFRKSIDKNKNS